MNISLSAERALIDLAERGYWLSVEGEKLRVVITRPGPVAALTDDLRGALARNRAELLKAIPALASDSVDLTGSVVRVLFATLEASDQERAISLRIYGDRRKENALFYGSYSSLSREAKIVYLWAMVYGPAHVAHKEVAA